MSLGKLDNLVKIGSLKKEAFNESEFKGLVSSSEKRLLDAKNASLASESRFDLAYNASHSLALAALRKQGYRPQSRYIVFQILPNIIRTSAEDSRIFSKSHDSRNLAEYEGDDKVDEQLLEELIAANERLLENVKSL